MLCLARSCWYSLFKFKLCISFSDILSMCLEHVFQR
jgi:hypothetical protein